MSFEYRLVLCERRGWCFTLVHSLHPVCRHDGDGQLSVMRSDFRGSR